MSDDKLIKEVIQANQELATRNSQAAVNLANQTRDELINRIQTLERTMAQIVAQVSFLNQKYNLLLSNRFNKGSTSEGE